jgi:predicted choloylglycine hydrolase
LTERAHENPQKNGVVPDQPAPSIESIETSGSHRQVGFAIGRRFQPQIRRILASYAFFRDRLLPYHRSSEGQSRFRSLLKLHRARFPDYCAELEGIAKGAECAFQALFLLNMRGEYRDHFRSQRERGCSDCALVTDEAVLIGHNEDGAPPFRENMFFVQAQVSGKPPFTALSYPGFLCGNAFGFNSHGLCFSVDDVRPRDGKVGLGRQFLARSLLEAHSIADAIRRVTEPNRASGFSYTIGSVPERRVVVVEVTPETHRVREIRHVYFHANHYLELPEVDQVIHPSSRARVERATAILHGGTPRGAGGILAILGDETHDRYPIFRTATPPDHSATLCTALFDIGNRELSVYTDHPVRCPDRRITFPL